MKIKIKKTNKDIQTPTYAHPNDAGLDLRSTKDITLQPNQITAITTGIKFVIPDGYVGLILGKSGHAVKHNIHCTAGVIDACYRGEISCILVNLGTKDFIIKKDMKIAQLLIQPVVNAQLVEVSELEDSDRGTKGYGSTGDF